MAESIVERLAEEARRAGLFLSPSEVADVLFLVSRMDEPTAGQRASDDGPPGEAIMPDTDPELEPPPDPDLESTSSDAGDGTSATAEAESPEFDFWAHSAERAFGAVPIRVPAAPAIARLEMAGALRPLQRRVPTDRPGELDADATAHQAADTDVFLPVFVPDEERWLDVAVVIDEAASMAVSVQTIDDLLVVLTELGAFRNVETWRFQSDDPTGEVLLHGPHSTVLHTPDELLDAAHRRVVLVVSDCLGRAWHDGRMADALEAWGKSGPVAIIQPLPQRLWERNAPPSHAVTLTAAGPGTANRDLAVLFEHPVLHVSLDPSVSSTPPVAVGVPVPMIELGPRWLARWASLVAGGERRFQGVAVFTDQLRHLRSSPRPGQAAPKGPDDIVAQFVGTASPSAQRLATLLAAAAPLTLPIMHLVQTAAFPEAPPTALREVFLGGLLQRRRVRGAKAGSDAVYDFTPEVRDQLLGGLTSAEAMTVLLAVSRYLTVRLGSSFDFLALLSNHGRPSELDEPARAFATVAAEVLEWMGGMYREKADQLRRMLEGEAPSEGEMPSRAESPSSSEIVNRGVVKLGGEKSPPVTPDVVGVPAVPAQSSFAATSGMGQRRPVGWVTVPPRNKDFVGRADTLERMHGMLINSSRTAVLLPRALYGLGGVGKTQLAIEYAHRYAVDYDLVWWVAAEDPAEIRRSLVELAEHLKIAVTEDSSKTIGRVHEALINREPFQRWLLIFDNVGEPESVRGLIPETDNGHVLVTTRIRSWGHEGQAVEVDKFRRPESLTLLQDRGKLSEADADLVAERVGDLPISLAQAAAWHQETKRPVSEYLRLFDDELTERGGDTDDEAYSSRAAVAMSLAFEQLKASAPLAARLLQLASYFGPEWISIDLLHRGRLATPLSRSLSGVLRDQAPLARAVRDIAKWELARFDTRTQRFQVHRLVQHMLQEDMPLEQRGEVRATVQTMLAFANPGNPDRIPPVERVKHAELSAHIVASGLIKSAEDEARQAVLDQIRYRFLVGDYDSSEELAEQAIAAWQGHDPTDPGYTNVLLAKRFIGNAKLARGQVTEAIDIARDVLQQFSNLLGPEHEHTLATLNGLSAALRAVGEFPNARKYDERNYRLQLRLLGDEDRITLRAANNLAVDLRMAGEYEEALRLDQETYSTSTRVYGPDDRDTLYRLANVARDLYALGRYPEALQRQREATAGLERILGLDHPVVLGVRRLNLVILRKVGRRPESARLAEELLLAYQNRLGPDHPETLLVMQSLCNALRDNREISKAVALGWTTLDRYRELYPQHPFTQVCAANLAIVLRQAGQIRAARELNESALTALTAALGPNHPYTLCCSANLASDLAAADERQAALELSGTTLDRSRRVRGLDQPYTLACQVNHAIDLIASGDEATGRDELDRAVTLMRTSPHLGEAWPDLELALDGKRIDCDIEPPPT